MANDDLEYTYRKPGLSSNIDVDRLISSLNQLAEENDELNSKLQAKFAEIKLVKKMLLNERMRALDLQDRIKVSEDKSDKPNDENSWLSFYADAITLILAFFVILYSMMSLDSGKFSETSTGIRQAFSSESIQSSESVSSVMKQLEEEFESISTEQGFVVNNNGGELRIRVHVSDLFPLGRAEFRKDESRVLEAIAEKIRKYQQKRSIGVEIQGHTDDIPINNKQFKNNWELSAMRATRTLEYLIQKGLDEKLIKASGYADSKPLPYSEGDDIRLHRAKNRRIEIVLSPTY